MILYFVRAVRLPAAVDNDGVTVGIATNFVDGSNVDAVAASLADAGDAASLRLRRGCWRLPTRTTPPAKRARRAHVCCLSSSLSLRTPRVPRAGRVSDSGGRTSRRAPREGG